MKRILLTIIITIAAAVSSYAQPKAMGIRLGATGLEADYQHSMSRDQFIEGNLGLDFGYNANGDPGIKAAAIYNFIWARPAWTEKGSWALYAGPGATIGYVNDMTVWKASNGVDILHSTVRNGFMLGICAQVGLEYTFWFPLQLSVDLRPVVGMHVNNGVTLSDPITGGSKTYGTRVGFYDNGLLGLVPTIAVRYRF